MSRAVGIPVVHDGEDVKLVRSTIGRSGTPTTRSSHAPQLAGSRSTSHTRSGEASTIAAGPDREHRAQANTLPSSASGSGRGRATGPRGSSRGGRAPPGRSARCDAAGSSARTRRGALELVPGGVGTHGGGGPSESEWSEVDRERVSRLVRPREVVDREDPTDAHLDLLEVLGRDHSSSLRIASGTRPESARKDSAAPSAAATTASCSSATPARKSERQMISGAGPSGPLLW